MAIARRAIMVALLLLPIAPTSARAGTYDVWSCNLTDGRTLPAEGWKTERWGQNTSAANDCAGFIMGHDGGLDAAFTGDTSLGEHVSWVFSAPSDTTISGYSVWRSAQTAASNGAYQDYIFSHDLPNSLDPQFFGDFCSRYASCTGRGTTSQPFAAENRFSRSNLEVRRLYASLDCSHESSGSSVCASSTGVARFTIYSARVALNDPYRPEFRSAPSGSLLATDTPLVGEKTVSLATGDRGGGIETVGVVVDGQARLTQRADPNAARCHRPFSALKPCPLVNDATLVFDTAQLSNGTHTIQVSATDASGNETRSDPVTVTALNGSQPNGRGASRFVRLAAWLRSSRDAVRSSLVVPYGSVRFAEGRLTDSSGTPIAGAVLQVVSRIQRPGAKEMLTGTVTTGEDGRFAYRIAKGPSRTVRFDYKAYSLDPAPVSTAAVSLGVRAGLKLRLRPRRVRNGQTVKFSGSLRGGPARKGTRVTIDVLVPDARRRVPIGNVRADSHGRFRFAYRFRRTLVRARYRFQARLIPQPAYPYRGATSRRVSVVVSP